MRRRARVDANQADFVSRIRKYGVSVLHMHTLGRGAPDLALGYRGANYFVELKDPEKTPSQQKLTPDELQFFENWRGQVSVIRTVEEALELIGI